MSHLAHARKVFDIELAALKAVRAQLGRAFDRATDVIVETLGRRGKIVVVGTHDNGGTTVRIELFGDKTEETERSLVQQVAYSIYERRGYTDGNDMGDWFEAEQKVRQAEKQLI